MASTHERIPKVLVTGPALHGRGGVANFYLHTLPRLLRDAEGEYNVAYMPIGRTAQSTKIVGPIADQLRIARALKESHKPALLHVNPSLNQRCCIRDGLFVWQAARQGVPTIVFFRGWSQQFERLVSRFWLQYFRHTFFRAAAIVVLGRVFEKRLRSWGYEGPVFRTTTVVDPNILNLHRDHSSRNGNRPSLLFLSRLEIDKGVLDILEALEILRRRKLIVQLTIAGEGKGRSSIERWLTSHPDCARQVRTPGYVVGKEKAFLFETHDIFLLPTAHGEGLPNSILEAMAAGMPVIASSAGAIGDVVEDCLNGFIVPPGNPEVLASAIEKLMANPHRFEEISRRNQHAARKMFTVDAVSAQLLAVYRAVLQGSRANRPC